MYFVYMDNLFSTPLLFRFLRDKDIAAVGSSRSNARGFPMCLVVRKSKLRLSWKTLGARLCEEGTVLALILIDNVAVQMLTTFQ